MQACRRVQAMELGWTAAEKWQRAGENGTLHKDRRIAPGHKPGAWNASNRLHRTTTAALTRE